MTSVGVALVNGVRKPGYVFATGFVGDGSQLTDIHTSNVNHAGTGQLAYYINPTTIGGDERLSFDDGNLYISGKTIVSNSLVYENTVISVCKGIVIGNSESNVMISGSHDLVNILGNVSAKNFFGNGSNLINTLDADPGTYGNGLEVPQVTIDSNGRLSSINCIPIQSSLESVTYFGTSTSKSIQFENDDVSFITHGKVGISNSNPSTLLCIGDGVQISNDNVSAKNFFGNGSKLVKTTDAYSGTYGDSLNTVQVTITKDGRLSRVDQIPIKTNLDTVTRYGSLSKSTIQLEHAPVSLTTTGKVGISNKFPDSLLCIGETTKFNESDLFMKGNVIAKNFLGDASEMINTSDIKPGIYGGGSLIPQIWVNDKGRISDIQVTSLFATLDQVTQFNSSTRSTIHLKNNETGLVSDGDIQVNGGKDVIWLDSFGNSVCTIGQKSEYDSRVAHFCGSQSNSLLNICDWEKVSINSGLSIDSKGFTTMKGCFMDSGTGYIMNAQQVSISHEDVHLNITDLFKWFSFDSPYDKKIYLPEPSVCQAGSWIGITNLSHDNDVIVYDSLGTTLYTFVKKTMNVGGKSKRMMCVSSLASSNGVNVMSTRWIVA